MKYLLLLIPIFLIANSDGKIQKQIYKGEKIASVFCETAKLPPFKEDINSTINALKASAACPNLSNFKLKLVAIYLQHKAQKKEYIKVPKDAKCPVCGMFVKKYPKWSVLMVLDGKKYYFDGVKDMLKFYFYDKDFKYDRDKIEKVLVQDFYTLEAIDATKAYYVVGSNIYGPMGKEFIPFKSKKEAQNFLNEHKGEKILRLKDITLDILKAQDN